MNQFDNFRVIDGAIYEGQSLIPEPIFTLTLQYWDGRGIEIEAIRVPTALRHKGTVFVLKNAADRFYKELDLIDLDLIRADSIRERDAQLRSSFLSQVEPIEYKPEPINGSYRTQPYTPDPIPPNSNFFKAVRDDQSQHWESRRGAINSYPVNPDDIDFLAEASTPAMLDLKFSKVIRETRTIQLQDPKPEI